MILQIVKDDTNKLTHPISAALNSAWDTPEEKGTQTVNAIVLVELGGGHNDIVLDAQSER